MAGQFGYFVVLAGMRTGSNYLEATLNSFDGVSCHGEVFNPSFVGHAGQHELFGMTMSEREADPIGMIGRMRAETDGLAGFRLFHDHDPRVLKHCLLDRSCAKIVLTRNVLDSFVSHEIARRTGQWRLNDYRNAKTARIAFDANRFRRHLEGHQAFQAQIRTALQASGQAAFEIRYDDLDDTAALNGMASFLGISARIKAASGKTKRQNPRPLRELVTNYDEMVSALAEFDVFGLEREAVFEPRRGAAVPGFVVAAAAPVLFMPIKGGPTSVVLDWLAALDGVQTDALGTGLTQKDLRQWKRRMPGHRSFTVVRHPALRLHEVFVRHVLVPGPECYTKIRGQLRGPYRLPIPQEAPGADFDTDAHRAAFIAFAKWVRANLGGQTGVRVDGAWASQTEVLRGFAEFAPPDHVLREDRLADELDFLARSVGLTSPGPGPTPEAARFSLQDIYDDDVEAAVRAAYQRDYMTFGFGPFGPAAR